MCRYQEEGVEAQPCGANSREPESEGSRWYVSEPPKYTAVLWNDNALVTDYDENTENADGLDKKFTLNYYSRMRVITNLLPLLQTASTTSPHFSRTLSVLGAGHEDKVNFDDLDLKNTFSGQRCAGHSIVMNDFMAEELAARNPGTSFVHSSPRVVLTGAARELPFWARATMKVFTPVISLFAVSAEETGARQLFLATSGLYPPAKPADGSITAAGVTAPKGVSVMKGVDGKVGSGGYLADWDGEITGKKTLLDEYHNKGVGQIVWEHTMGVFAKVDKNAEAKPDVK